MNFIGLRRLVKSVRSDGNEPDVCRGGKTVRPARNPKLTLNRFDSTICPVRTRILSTHGYGTVLMDLTKGNVQAVPTLLTRSRLTYYYKNTCA